MGAVAIFRAQRFAVLTPETHRFIEFGIVFVDTDDFLPPGQGGDSGSRTFLSRATSASSAVMRSSMDVVGITHFPLRRAVGILPGYGHRHLNALPAAARTIPAPADSRGGGGVPACGPASI